MEFTLDPANADKRDLVNEATTNEDAFPLMFAMLMTTGAALAEGESTPGGRDLGTMPTSEQCYQGWDPSMRMTEVEFNWACDNL